MRLKEMISTLIRSGRDIRNVEIRGNKVFAIEYIANESVSPFRRSWTKAELAAELDGVEMLNDYYETLSKNDS